MIVLEHLSFDYENSQTINDVSLRVKKGDFTAILGANGAGKSTLAKLVRGLLKPTVGSVHIDGVDLTTVKASSLGAKIGFLFQNPDRQICKSTVLEELKFSLSCIPLEKTAYEARLARTLTSFDLDPNGELFRMSRGERQRVALASVLIGEPDLLILDEPTTGLDYRECIHIMDMVKALNEQGVTILMITHDMEIALDYAKHAVILNHGSVAAVGNVKELFYHQEILTEAKLLPPQIIGLSLALDEDLGQVCSVNEMTAAIKERRKRRNPS